MSSSGGHFRRGRSDAGFRTASSALLGYYRGKNGLWSLGHNIYHTLGMNLKGREEYFKSVYGQEFPFDKFTEAYREESRKIQEAEGVPVKKGLLELMAFLKKEGFALAVATSSSQERTREKLKGCGVWGDFSVIICGDQVRRSKPDRNL